MKKWIYRGSTGLLSAMMLMSAGMYIANYNTLAENFIALGHPVHIIYPLAIAKIAAVAAIVSRRSAILSEWAYAGLTYVFVLATLAHINAGDGQFIGPIVALGLLGISYFTAHHAPAPGAQTLNITPENSPA